MKTEKSMGLVKSRKQAQLVNQQFNTSSLLLKKVIGAMSRMTQQEAQDFAKLFYGVKQIPNGNEGQWTYITSQGSTLTNLDYLMRRYKLNSIVDLGCGLGELMTAMHILGYKTKGLEIEKSLSRLALQQYYGGVPTINTDILNPSLANNIRDMDAIYMYEPVSTIELATKLVKNLENCTKKGQYIFLKSAGHIRPTLEKSVKFKNIYYTHDIYVFKVK